MIAYIVIITIQPVSQWDKIFFGHPSDVRENQLEESYILIRHLKMTYSDVISMPVAYRRWFLERYLKDLKDRNKEVEKITDNSPDFSSLSKFEKKIGVT